MGEGQRGLMASQQAAPLQTREWNTLYPAYISKNKTKPQGRRIPLEKAIEHPHPMEMGQACKDLGYNCVVEDKAYSRDILMRGRVKVELKTGDGEKKIGKQELLLAI